MLKQRLLTAAILAPLVIWAIISLSTPYLGLLLALFTLVGAWEWAQLIGIDATPKRLAYVVVIGLCLALADVAQVQFSGFHQYLFLIAGAWWLLGTWWVFRYKGHTGLNSRDTALGVLIGMLVLVPTWVALIHIHGYSTQGPYLMLFVMVLIWTADSGAYFAGKMFGKHKLAPCVSPGKTVEGVIGGVVLSALCSLVGAYLFDLPDVGLVGFMLISLAVVLFSVVGDLLESLFKRRVGVKDSGIIFPGHGGVLDRIDSLTAAAPIFALGLTISEMLG